MTDLLWQLWFTLLTAFGFGALFGWLLKSWRAHTLQIAIRDGGARCDSLQAENGKQRDELKESRERLRTQESELQTLRSAAATAQSRPAELIGSEPDPAAAAALAQLTAQLTASQQRIAALDAQRAEAAAVLAVRLGESAALKVELERVGGLLRQEQRERSALETAGQQSRDVARVLEQQKAQLARALEEAQASAMRPAADPALNAALLEARNQRAAGQRELESLRTQLEQAQQTVLELTAAARTAAAAPAQPLLIAPITPDDLQQIRGVGPKIARLLHQLDVHSFRQIALASDAELDRLAAALPGFASRVQREDWRGQCARLHLQKYGVAP